MIASFGKPFGVLPGPTVTCGSRSCKPIGILGSMTSLTQSRRGGRGARARIMTAASELFYFEGINATGVERIASRASVSKRTLYRYFPSKTALVEEYLQGLRQKADDAEGASPDIPDP